MSELGPALLTVDEVAERLRVHKRTVAAWIRKGRLPVIRITRRIHRIREQDLEALLVQSAPRKHDG